MHILLHRRRASESQSVQGQFDMVQAGERRSQHAHTMCHSSPSRDSTHDLLGQDDDCLGEVLMAAFAKFLTHSNITGNPLPVQYLLNIILNLKTYHPRRGRDYAEVLWCVRERSDMLWASAGLAGVCPRYVRPRLQTLSHGLCEKRKALCEQHGNKSHAIEVYVAGTGYPELQEAFERRYVQDGNLRSYSGAVFANTLPPKPIRAPLVLKGPWFRHDFIATEHAAVRPP